MLERMFPATIDNVFRGPRLAIWLLLPITLSKLLMGANSVVNTHFVATVADHIPVDSYGAAGASAVISFFSLWGLFTVLLALQGIVVLLRYRSATPLIYLTMLAEQLGRKAILLVHPIAAASTSSAGFTINFVLFGLLAAGFVISLLPPRSSAAS